MRGSNRLTAKGIEQVAEPGYYADGGNLYLQVSRSGTKSWLLRYSYDGRRREMGLGPYPLVALNAARAAAVEKRLMLLQGRDPLQVRNNELQARRSEIAKAITFKECAEQCMEDKRPEWKNAKHAQQWENTLTTYAYPHIGALDVRTINTGLVRNCLDPIWTTKTETANRLRQRIEMILDWAKVHGYRTGDNPAVWRGHLEAVMPAPKKIAKIETRAAVPYVQMPAFLDALQSRKGMSALALQFVILTAARTGEVLGARRGEIDEAAALWTIPAGRMKAGVEHVVPLPAAALRVLKAAREAGKGSAWVFPSTKPERALSNMSMLELVRGMGITDATGRPITVHGFRSTFRDWTAECTAHPRDVAEHALAHRLPDKTEAAYQRGTLLEKRRKLMDDWAAYIGA